MTAIANRLRRRPFIAELLAQRGTALIVPGLGSPNWDVFAAGDSPDYLYTWGGMGLAVPIAHGVALAQPRRRVFALEGDGSILMQLGSLATVASRGPKNLGLSIG